MRRRDFVLLSVGLIACNAIAGLDGDFEAADGGIRSPNAEGGASSSSSGGSSGGTSSSSSSSSSGSPVDSGADVVDASIARDADSGPDLRPFCEKNPTNSFCWDFNGGGTLAGKFGWTSAFANPTTELLTDPGTDGFTLHTIVNPNGSSKTSGLLYNVAFTSQTLTMTFRFKVTKAENYAVIGALQISSGEHGLATTNVCSVTAPCVIENQPGNIGSHPTRTKSTGEVSVAGGGWHTGKVTVTWDGTSKWKGEVSVDGVSLATRDDAIFPSSSVKASNYDVLVGSWYSGTETSTTTETNIDDVLVVAQ